MSSIYSLLKQTIDKLSSEISKTYTYVDNKISTIDTSITKADVESVLTGTISSHTHSSMSVSKESVEAVLTGEISTHSHALKTINGETIIGSGDIEISSGPMLSSPGTIYVTQEKTLTITNYDGFSTYSVDATNGIASITGDTITYTAPSVDGIDTLIITVNGIAREILLTINAAAVVKPSITSPVENYEASGSITITTSGFQTIGLSDTHVASKYVVYNSMNEVVYDSGEDVSGLTSKTIDVSSLTKGSIYFVSVYHRGEVLGWSLESEKIQFGIKLIEITGIALTVPGGGGGTWNYIDYSNSPVSTYQPSYFSAHSIFGNIQDVVIDGQYMVKIPKFYINRKILESGDYFGKEAWFICDQPLDGFSIHPAFMHNGSEINQFYVGKYQAGFDGSKLTSQPGIAPAVNRTLTQFLSDASARNTGGVSGFMLWNIHHWSAIQWLYILEMATMDSQTKTGAGRVNESSVANVDASDVAQATYRGIVGLWGNVWQWLDGFKTSSGIVNVFDNNGNKTWINTGQTPPNINNTTYPVSFMNSNGSGFDLDSMFIAKTGPTSNSGATAPDYQYFASSGELYPLVGGFYGYGASAGLFLLNANSGPSFAYSSLGSRLAKV